MVGLPFEEKEDIYATAKLINKLRKIDPRIAYGIATFRPYPKSEICESLKQKGIFKEPENLRQWSDDKYVKNYTERTRSQPWQKYPRLASNVSFYYTMASGVLLGNHQISNKVLRGINSFFISLGMWRTEKLMFACSIDKAIYVVFYRSYIKVDTLLKSRGARREKQKQEKVIKAEVH